MTDPRFAESVLSLACGRERAAEIVGDLLEQHPGQLEGVYLGVLRVLLATYWRNPAAMGTWLLLLIPACAPFGFYVRSITDHHGDMSEIIWPSRCLLAWLCMLSTVVFSAFRLGFRNRVTQAGFGTLVILAMIACLVHTPHRLGVAAGLCLLALAIVCSLRTMLVPLLCSLVSALSFGAVFNASLGLVSRLHDPAPGLVFGCMLACWLVSSAIELSVLSQAQRWKLVG